MKQAALAVLVMWVGAASADTKKAPACVPEGGSPRTYVAGGKPVVCWADGKDDCLEIGDKPADRKAVKHPAEAAKAGAPDKPGKKLAAELKKADVRVSVSDDRSLVSVSGENGVALWSVAKDAVIALKQPASYKGGGDKPALVNVSFVGNVIVASWSDCAGPCTRGQIVTADGKNVGKDFEDGFAVAVDGKRIAVAGENGTLTVLEAATAKVLGTADTKLAMPSIAAVTGTEVFMIANQPDVEDTKDAWKMRRATIASSGKPSLGDVSAVPGCPQP